jgi:hypothetical protein
MYVMVASRASQGDSLIPPIRRQLSLCCGSLSAMAVHTFLIANQRWRGFELECQRGAESNAQKPSSAASREARASRSSPLLSHVALTKT